MRTHTFNCANLGSLRAGLVTVLFVLSTLLYFTTANAQESAPAAPKVHKWRLATAWSGYPLHDEISKKFAERVATLTSNAVQISGYPAGVIGNPLQVTDTVKNGVAQAGHSFIGYDWGKDKTAVLFSGIAGSMSVEALLAWLYVGGGAEQLADWRKKKFGIVSIPLGARSAEVFLHSRKPIRTLEDLKGTKVRTTGAWIEISRSLGAAPVSASSAEVYQLLERGAVDAIEWGTPWENLNFGFHKVAKYLIVPGVHQPSAIFELQINPKSWDQLSAQQKASVLEAAKTVTLDYWARDGIESARALKKMLAEGAELVVLSEEVQSRAAQLGNEWMDQEAKGDPEFKRVLDSQRAFIAEWKDWAPFRKSKDNL